MVLTQQFSSKDNTDCKYKSNFNQQSQSNLNWEISKTLKSVQLLMQESNKDQNFQLSPLTESYKISKNGNLVSSNLCNPQNLLYSSAISENINNYIYNGNSNDNHENHNKFCKFPDTFNPRKELNMPHKEKVEKWIIGVPTLPNNERCDSWTNCCYNPMLPTSNEFEDNDEESNIDFSGNDDVIEYQSRMITFLVNKNYFNDSENVRKRDGKLIPGGIEYDTYINHIMEYNNINHTTNFDQFDYYNLRR